MQIEVLARRLLGLALAAAWWAWTVEAGEPVVSNVRAAQRVGRLAVEITYDVAAADGDRLVVSVAMSEDGGRTRETIESGLSGDVGPGVTPGAGKQIVWEPGVEWLGRSCTRVEFRVKATGIHPVRGMGWLRPGRFTMGSPAGEVGRDQDEGPETEVTLSQGFWLGKCEVTQREWVEIMGSNPSLFKGDPDLPVEQVSWGEAMEFCRRLTEQERGAGRLPEGFEYRLPTEAQWEYACRAGTKSAAAFGGGLSSTQANFNGAYPYSNGAKGPYMEKTTKVGSYAPNACGLYDMHGNVWEWCLDGYAGQLPGRTVTDPKGPSSATFRVFRGGGWLSFGQACRSASRDGNVPGYRLSYLGFRLALVAGS